MGRGVPPRLPSSAPSPREHSGHVVIHSCACFWRAIVLSLSAVAYLYLKLIEAFVPFTRSLSDSLPCPPGRLLHLPKHLLCVVVSLCVRCPTNSPRRKKRRRSRTAARRPSLTRLSPRKFRRTSCTKVSKCASHCPSHARRVVLTQQHL